MLAATRRGVDILRGGGSALEAVIATVEALENDEYFNAGYGSVLNTDGRVEMDAALMVAGAGGVGTNQGRDRIPEARAGAVAAVSRVRNPILLARAVMETTPHILMVGGGAERLARRAGIALCRPDELVTPRAKARWRLMLERKLMTVETADGREGGTVGAVAIDSRGALASATSTGGMTGKLPGRVGDSALIGAGVYADAFGASSATGQGEAIIILALCREAVRSLRVGKSAQVARAAILELGRQTGAEAGIIIVDRRGRLGFAHNAGAMEVATFDPKNGMRHYWPKPIT
jgi:beta-aspartyl-peptidase (threonine type)